MADPSITLLTPDPHLGGQVDFAFQGVPKKVRRPRVEVRADQPTNTTNITCIAEPDGSWLTYAEARGLTDSQADYIGANPIVLGGGMSAWFVQGGPAHCTANLFYFDDSGPAQQYLLLASTTFEAAG